MTDPFQQPTRHLRNQNEGQRNAEPSRSERGNELRFASDLLRKTKHGLGHVDQHNYGIVVESVRKKAKEVSLMDPLTNPYGQNLRGGDGRTLDSQDYDTVGIGNAASYCIPGNVFSDTTWGQTRDFVGQANRDSRRNLSTFSKYVSANPANMQKTTLGEICKMQETVQDHLHILRNDPPLQPWRKWDLSNNHISTRSMINVPRGQEALNINVNHMDPELVASYIQQASAPYDQDPVQADGFEA